MSTVQEIAAAIPQLSRTEAERLRAWLDEIKAALDQSSREIAKQNRGSRASPIITIKGNIP